jgi:hypothetical protein
VIAKPSLAELQGPSARQTIARNRFAATFARGGRRATQPATPAELAAVAALG